MNQPPLDRDFSFPAGLGLGFTSEETSPRLIKMIYIDAGGGHRSSAMALREVIGDYFPSWDVELINLFQDVLRPIDPLHRVTGTYNSEDIYNRLLKHNWTYGFHAGMRGLQKLIKISAPIMEKLLRQHWEENRKPDMVVSLIPHFNAVMFRALKQVYPDAPYVTIMTDIADYPPHMWQERQDQFLICGSDMAIQQAKRTGYGPSRLFRASGMILKPDFYELTARNDRDVDLRKLGLDPELPTALIMFGGYGASTAEKIVTALENSPCTIQSIVMCGRNEKLRQKLQRHSRCYPAGFTTNGVPHYMRLADFFVGKPGPGSISEALHIGLPVIVERNRRTMPQERYNTDWIKEKKVGVVLKSFAEINDGVQYLLKDNHLEELRQNARKMSNRAVYEIPFILENIMAMHHANEGIPFHKAG